VLSRLRLLTVVIPLATRLLDPAAAFGAEPLPQPGWHTVRPGETLRGITEQYLGSEDRWDENWRLNPSVRNPDLLLPGQRLLVYQAVDQTVPTVRLTAVSGRVERRPLPIPWDPARQDDLLIERDGIRTFDSSSTEILFIDGTSVVLSEDSLIFLRQTGRGARNVESNSVEIVEGQAEIAVEAGDVPAADVEIVLGDAVARPRRDAAGVSQARASRDVGGSKVMVFEGSGEVASAGGSVELTRGTGTSVAQNAPPTPPERLLPAPVPSLPEAGVRLALPDPTFVWEAVPGAASYTVEVCGDPGCRQLVRREPGRPSNAWDSEPLPIARLYWRVSAVSATGLDGYPSRTVPFEIVSDRQDTEPPTGRLILHGESLSAPRAPTIWGPAVRIEPRLTDDRSGVRSWSATVNGRPVEQEALLGPWRSGAYTVAVEAVDAAGNSAEIGPVHFLVDDAPPVIELRIGQERLLEQVVQREGTPGVVRALPPFVMRGERTAGAPAWHVLAWGNESSPSRDNFLPRVWPWEFERGFRWVSLKGRRPELLINAPGLEVPWNGGTRVLGASDYLWIAATDEHSGYVASLLVGEEVSPDGQTRRLVIELADAVGSRGVLRWDFR
jgi:hypothetical protein